MEVEQLKWSPEIKTNIFSNFLGGNGKVSSIVFNEFLEYTQPLIFALHEEKPSSYIVDLLSILLLM